VEVATKQLSTVVHIDPLEDGYQLLTEEQALSMSEHPYYWKEEAGTLVHSSPEEQGAVDRDMIDGRQAPGAEITVRSRGLARTAL
jgi:hypothetical protein